MMDGVTIPIPNSQRMNPEKHKNDLPDYNLYYDLYPPRKRKQTSSMVGCLVLMLAGGMLLGIALAGIFFLLAGGRISFDDTAATQTAIAANRLHQTQTALAVIPSPTLAPTLTPVPSITATASPETFLPNPTITITPTPYISNLGYLPTPTASTREIIDIVWLDDRQLLVATPQAVYFFDVAVQTFTIIRSAPSGERIVDMAWSNEDPKPLAIAYENGRLELHRLDNGTFRTWTADNSALQLFAVSFSPNGQRIYAATNTGQIYEWDTENLALRGNRTIPNQFVMQLTVNPANNRLATGGIAGDVIVTDLAQNQARAMNINAAGFIKAVRFSPDGVYLASLGEDNRVYINNANTGEVVDVLTGHALSISFGVADTLLIGGQDGTVSHWEVVIEQRILAEFDHDTPILSVAWRSDGAVFATGGQDGTLTLWQVADNEQPFIQVGLPQ